MQSPGKERVVSAEGEEQAWGWNVCNQVLIRLRI